jgi:hypothetical protein
MADIAELKQIVRDNPDDHEQRWHLAKKLYRVGEYRSSLKHLQYLRENWTPKLNVFRYLAATYYRMGRYQDSVAQLEDALREWPDEIPLREQLARVFEVTGDSERSGAVWQEILRMNPDNTVAQQALVRKNDEPRKEEPEKKADAPATAAPPPVAAHVPLQDHDFGLDFGTGVACPNCGAFNTEEFERCWKCHALLSLTSSDSEAPRGRNRNRRRSSAAVWTPIAAIGLVFILAGGIYLTLTEYMAIRQNPAEEAVFRTVYGTLNAECLLTRLVMGLVMLGVWPFVLWVTVTLLGLHTVDLPRVFVTGLFLAGVMFLVLWLPPQYVPYFALLLLLLSALPMVVFFEINPFSALEVWAIQLVVVICCMVACFVLREGGAALKGFPAVMRYAKQHDAAPDAGVLRLPQFSTPYECTFTWAPSGSEWFDAKAGKTSVKLEAGDTGLFEVELKDVTGTVFYDPAAKMPFTFTHQVVPARQYQLLIKGAPTQMTATVTGVLEVRTGK